LDRASLSGRRLGVYQVDALIGAGGMGEVYRARDTKLRREVAIKVLPPALTADATRLARFEREARLLAALNHPNIATIHGFEELGSSGDAGPTTVTALVMELIDGQTIADRFRGARVPLNEALRIARQIADALDAAHEKGIIHRDLKPANVAVTSAGLVKVLDFGIAKLAPSTEPGDASAVTLTIEPTSEGMVVGSAAYMSPEQARGQNVDKRTDIWAFGCVLYEMLAGRAAFARATVTDTLTAVLEHQPDWTALPPATPPHVRGVLRRCLEKDVRRRARDIGDVRMELEEADPAAGTAGATGGDNARRGVLVWAIATAAIAAVAIIAVLAWIARDPVPVADPAVTRTTLTLAPNQELDTGGGAAPLAISPDGRRLAYVAVADGRTQLYVRSLDAFEPRAIAGTDGAQYPFFSPDGGSVAFFADRRLKRVSMQGGSPVTVCDVPTLGRGGTWGADETIVFDPGDAGLLRVSAAGGQPEPLTSRDPAIDRDNLSWPHFLPDGRTLLVTTGRFGSLGAGIAALSLETGAWQRLGTGSQAQYLPAGFLVYHAQHVREGELHAVPFDARTLTVRGAPVAVADSVFRAQDGGGVYYAVAHNGTMVFTPGGYARTLVRVDRHGRRTPLLDERRGFRRPNISPDGLKVAVTIDPRPSQIWVYDLARKSRIALATDGHNHMPLWTPDGQRIAYSSDPGSSSPPLDIFWRAADGGTAAERLLRRDGAQYPTSWTADGRQLIFEDGAPNGYDIWTLPLSGEPRPLIATAASELGGQLSPDGRWLAYQSNESGRFEVYVRPFPNVNDGKWTISTVGGQHALWSENGKELFYAAGSAVMRVAVDTRGPRFTAGAPELLFNGPFDINYTNYALAKDGSHFIMVEVDPNARPTQVSVTLNWAQDVERLTSAPRR
jgi:eukaryotic-like serine/threonine-protein kinase